MCLIISISTTSYSGPVEVKVPGNLELAYYGKEATLFYSEPLYKVRVANKILYVIPGVSQPSIYSIWFLEHTTIYEGEDVLDLGTGTGVHGIFAAEKARKVVSSDISELSVENVKLNTKLHEVDNIIEARQGDLLRTLKNDEQFDVILFTVGLPDRKEKQGSWELHERFFRNVDKHLKPHGRIYYLSSFVDNIPHLQSMIEKNHFQIIKLDMVAAVKRKREPIVIMIQRKTE